MVPGVSAEYTVYAAPVVVNHLTDHRRTTGPISTANGPARRLDLARSPEKDQSVACALLEAGICTYLESINVETNGPVSALVDRCMVDTEREDTIMDGALDVEDTTALDEASSTMTAREALCTNQADDPDNGPRAEAPNA